MIIHDRRRGSVISGETGYAQGDPLGRSGDQVPSFQPPFVLILGSPDLAVKGSIFS